MKFSRIIFFVFVCSLPLALNAQKGMNKRNALSSTQQLKEISESVEGFISVHYGDNKIYFELPDSILGRDMLLAVRASELSSNKKHIAAGQMRHNPMLIRFTADDELVYMHQLVSNEYADKNDPVSISLERNNLVPVIDAFKITQKSENTVTFDFTEYLKEPISPISPFSDKAKPGRLNPKLTKFISVKAFEKNIEIKTRFGFDGREPFLAIMQRSFVLLPKQMMKPRINDERVGYFNEGKRLYASDQIGVKSYAYIGRFNVLPKNEDIDAYKKGILVEPEKPIVFYVDNAIPDKWKPFIKAGIEDWQLAFEAIGFKNAIVAKDYPVNDPEFDPDNIQYNCFRYVTISDANAQGQKWIDPRSGETFQADVIWYSNVLEKLYQWLFVQTAAANESVRGSQIDDQILGELIRYAAAHEIGHCLGLAHNFRSSYAFPVDSLRSASFTQKNGSCASLMDYARNNYIAQPGDKNIKFTPPIMGEYDYFAIKYGYKPIFEAETEFDELPILNQWILEKVDNPVYLFTRNQSSSDPASQSEALGDDVVKAGKYGADNIRVILTHMVDWLCVENQDYSSLATMHKALMKQYGQYFKHAYAQIGGVYEYLGVHGEGKPIYRALEKAKQKEALTFVLNELFHQFEWMNPIHISSKIGTYEFEIYDFQKKAMETLLAKDQFYNIIKSASISERPYSVSDYLNDLTSQIFTNDDRELSKSVRNIQSEYVKKLADILKNPKDYTTLENEVMPFVIHQLKEINAFAERKAKKSKGEQATHYWYITKLSQ